MEQNKENVEYQVTILEEELKVSAPSFKRAKTLALIEYLFRHPYNLPILTLEVKVFSKIFDPHGSRDQITPEKVERFESLITGGYFEAFMSSRRRAPA